MTSSDFPLGAPIPDEYRRAVEESRYTLLILSAASSREQWVQYCQQLAAFLSVEEQQNRLIPLLLGPIKPDLGIRCVVSLNFSDQDEWATQAQRLRTLLAWPTRDDQADDVHCTSIDCPYPGMRPFKEADKHHFFGREQEIAYIRQQVQQQAWVFVIGPSGSGKSSLVFAGLLPTLTEGWQIHKLRLGYEPTKGLQKLLDAEQSHLSRSHATAIGGAVRPSPQRLLLVIDQFEELFTLVNWQEQERFIDMLHQMRSDEQWSIVITLRADFYASLMASKLWPIDDGERLDIGPLRGTALRQAIQCPAENVNVYLEPALLERLLADADDEPGSLPLIQETMKKLWPVRQACLLTLQTYTQFGKAGRSGLSTAVSELAERTYMRRLSPAQKAIAKRVFLCLVQFAEGCPDTRRQQPLHKLRSDTDDPRDFDATLKLLTENRLLTVSDETSSYEGSNDQFGTQQLVEISHDVLLTGWPRLQNWISTDRTNLQRLRPLVKAVDEWYSCGEQADFLYTGNRLQEARLFVAAHPEYLEANQRLRTFLEASDAHDTLLARSRYVNEITGGASGTALGYACAFAMGFWFNISAQSTGLLIWLFMLPFGGLVGLCISFALWRWQRSDAARTRSIGSLNNRLFPSVGMQAMRVVVTGLIGAVSGGLASALYGLVFESAPGEYIAVGALSGASIGAGVAVHKHYRLIATTLSGLLGLLLTHILYGWPRDLWVALLAGVVLGGLTGLGFSLASVPTHQTRSQVTRWTLPPLRWVRMVPQRVYVFSLVLIALVGFGTTCMGTSQCLSPFVATLTTQTDRVEHQQGGGKKEVVPHNVRRDITRGDTITVDQHGLAEVLLRDYGRMYVYHDSVLNALVTTVQPAPNAPPIYPLQLKQGTVLTRASRQAANIAATTQDMLMVGNDTFTDQNAGAFVYYDPGQQLKWVVAIDQPVNVRAGGQDVLLNPEQQTWVKQNLPPVAPVPATRSQVPNLSQFPPIDQLTNGALTDLQVLRAHTIHIAPTTVLGGTVVTGTVTLSSPAPAGGQDIALQSDNPAVVSVPPRISIPAGADQALFKATANAVSNETNIIITAMRENVAQAATLSIKTPRVTKAWFGVSSDLSCGGSSFREGKSFRYGTKYGCAGFMVEGGEGLRYHLRATHDSEQVGQNQGMVESQLDFLGGHVCSLHNKQTDTCENTTLDLERGLWQFSLYIEDQIYKQDSIAVR